MKASMCGGTAGTMAQRVLQNLCLGLGVLLVLIFGTEELQHTTSMRAVCIPQACSCAPRGQLWLVRMLMSQYPWGQLAWCSMQYTPEDFCLPVETQIHVRSVSL